MSIPVPLSVRLKTARRDVHVTDELSDVSFTTNSPGGFEACTITLHRPLTFMPAEVAQFGQLYVYDSRGTIWEGRMQDPGRTASEDGETYEITAMGGQAHLSDDTRMYYAIDTDYSHWAKTDVNGTRGATVNQETDINPAGDESLVLRIPQGTAVDGSIPSRVVAAHKGIAEAGQKLARIAFDWDVGLTTANITISLYAGTYGTGPADVPYTTTFNTAGAHVGRILGSWTNGRDWPIIRFHYTVAGAAVVNADSWWLEITNLVVKTMAYTKAGVEITDYDVATNVDYAGDYVFAWQVVEDLLGRTLTATIDGANAVVDLTSFHIEHLTYVDGASPATILDDLTKLEQGFTYHVWESNESNGKYKFEWVAWPTAVRYEADVNDGYTAPASGNTLYNRVGVRWINRGVTHLLFRTQTVPALDDLGLTRTAYIDLTDNAGVRTHAERVGDQFLEEHKYPLNTGRLEVKQPILDVVRGRMVYPWEIRAGAIIRVRGVESYPNSLNNDGRDGLTVFKIVATTYTASDNTAVLELDGYAPSVARALRALRNKPPRRR